MRLIFVIMIWWREQLGTPLFVCAPMVEQSEAAFRVLTRRYGCQLAYTPMLHARLFSEDAKYRAKYFPAPTAEDRPLFAHFCGNDPETLLRAARLVTKDMADAIDINLGCPQGIARQGHYGAFLLEDPDLIESIVSTLVRGQDLPVTVKIRKVPGDDSTYSRTLGLVRRLEKAGVSAICVHGRFREAKGQNTGECDWEVIKAVKCACNVPVIGNGGIETRQDAERMMRNTGVDAVMSAEALLENPALFADESITDTDKLAHEYLDLCNSLPSLMPQVKSHLFRFLYTGLQVHTDLRDKLAASSSMSEFRDVAGEMRRRRAGTSDRIGWYSRHRCLLQRSLPEEESDEESLGLTLFE
ncbi:MAG: uncharacterized protein KVP18_004159 [Porospora cf. gigantea A]|uniref:uncharacterized protein n=2 Tax=Porospora cf. gigantea A TaxID=2853593 RepID=UPI003559F7DA|nr:MAG: hypothetical protein KVP18_004159 [Porospora cf. gigantea A]